MTEVGPQRVQSLSMAVIRWAVRRQQAAAVKSVARLRRLHPQKTPAQLVTYLTRFYLAKVSVAGLSAGATYTLDMGTLTSWADKVAFVNLTARYVLAVAEICGVDNEDEERRTLLVAAVVAGDAGAKKLVDPLLDRTAPHLGKKIVDAIPMDKIKQINDVFGPHFVTKRGTKQGKIVLVQAIPAAIGAAIGAGGSTVLGLATVKATALIVGPPPDSWNQPGDLSIHIN